MEERAGMVTFLGNPLTLLGAELKQGDRAPEATLLDNDLNPVLLTSFRNKVCIITSVPSLDTPVCEMETRRFNEAAGKLSGDIQILTVSMDLPFAQKRWCGAMGVDRVLTLSDHRDANFGISYGVLIKELRLLARAVFIVDRQGLVRHIQLVKEVSEEPNYDEILQRASELV